MDPQKKQYQTIPTPVKNGANTHQFYESEKVQLTHEKCRETGNQGKQMFATVQPKRAIVLISENRSKRVFPLYRDHEIGINPIFQNRVHETHNDDDRMTTSTQMGLAISQTYPNYKDSSSSSGCQSQNTPYSYY